MNIISVLPITTPIMVSTLLCSIYLQDDKKRLIATYIILSIICIVIGILTF